MLTPADVGRDCQPKKLIRLLYTEYSMKPGGHGEEYSSNWSREHIFPQSRLSENIHCCDANQKFV